MPKKNLSRLVPVKRNVVNKKTGSVNDITYYIDPNKDAKKDRHRNEADPPNKDTDTLTNVKKPNDSKDTLDPESGADNSKKLNAKDASEDPATNNTKTGKKGDLFEGVKDFEDFGKKGIDPSAARQFFCNM